jgi:site-specific DNA-methyltransferase (adenine-specific)
LEGVGVKPYYEQDGITIYHGKAEVVLPTLRADAVVTDPPFGIKDKPITKGTNRRGTNTWHPETDWDDDVKPEWCRLSCEAAPLVAWFGHWRKRDEVAASMPHPIRAEIVWAKDMHTGHPCPLAMRDERIWLFSSVGITGKRFETSVWDEPVIPTWSHKFHKNEKPLALMKRLLMFLVDGGTIIDPFMGSGTTLVAAKELGLRAIGIDINERYCETAANRLRQGVLFGAAAS